MTDDVFERFAEALDRLPNGFPRTDSGVEIRILKKIFSPEEAALASLLTGRLEPVSAITRRAGQPAGEVSKQLFKMVRRGMIWLDKQDGKACFRLAPFVIGLYEAQIELLDHELAHLIEDYFAGGGAVRGGNYCPEDPVTRTGSGLPGEDVQPAVVIGRSTGDLLTLNCANRTMRLYVLGTSPCGHGKV